MSDFNGLNNNFNSSGVNSIINVLKTANNPATAFQMLLNNNPALKNVFEMCRGKNPRDVFYDECKRRGVDPETILQKLR